MPDILSKIDDAVAYLESDEYLRQARGRDGYDLGDADSVPGHTNTDRARWVDAVLAASDAHEMRASRRAQQRATDRATPGRRLQLSTRDSHTVFADALSELRAFKTYGALRGNPVTGAHNVDRGHLPAEWRVLLREHGNSVDYVVYSYSTPIAWHSEVNGWIRPDHRYSVTTSKHQSTINAAIRVI